MKRLFDRTGDAQSLAQIIVDAVREPLLVLDTGLTILFGSKSFQGSFQIGSEHLLGTPLAALDGGAWNIPALQTVLVETAAGHPSVDHFEITHDFPRAGRRILILRARKLVGDTDEPPVILLGIEDVTAQRAVEREKEALQKRTDDLLLQKAMLLEEMQHRIVNSLQIIASILMLKARAVTSVETRQHLEDAHRRVMSVAAVQQYLHSSGRGDAIEIAPYLTKLCESLAESMIGESSPATLKVVSDDGKVVSADAVSLGLIVTELVINALKYAFPGQTAAATVIVRYEVNGASWKLSVSDNGVGKPDPTGVPVKGGLGTSLVNALASQLDAQVKTESGPDGLSVSITHATFTSQARRAA